MSMFEMDDLLDQLEEEVECERRNRIKEDQHINEHSNENDLTLNSSHIHSELKRPMEEQSLMSDSKSNGNQSHLNEVLSVPKVNGNYVEKIDKDSADNEDKSTLENNLVEQGKETPVVPVSDKVELEHELSPTINEPKEFEECSINVSLELTKTELIVEPTNYVVNDNQRFDDSSTVQQTLNAIDESTTSKQTIESTIKIDDQLVGNSVQDQKDTSIGSNVETIPEQAVESNNSNDRQTEIQEIINNEEGTQQVEEKSLLVQDTLIDSSVETIPEQAVESNNSNDHQSKAQEIINNEEDTQQVESNNSNETTVIEEVIELKKTVDLAHVDDSQNKQFIKETVDLQISMPEKNVELTIEAVKEVPSNLSEATKEDNPKSSEEQQAPKTETSNELVLSDAAYEMAKNLLEEIGDVQSLLEMTKVLKVKTEAQDKKAEEKEETLPESIVEKGNENTDDNIDLLVDQPGPSNNVVEVITDENIEDPQIESPAINESESIKEEQLESPTIQEPEPIKEVPIVTETRKSVILSTHAVGNNVGNDLRLTESELQLGKSKPIWIKDEDCKKCMLCTAKFTLVNRRHHCRCCGRVLCSECCSIRRSLPYMQQDEKKQRVCSPCNSTLDRIELYEKAAVSSIDQPTSSASSDPTASSSSATTSSFFIRKKSVLKNRSKSENEASQVDQHSAATDQTPTSDARRSVKFLDGISPGDELSPTSRQPESSGRQSAMFGSRPTRSSRSSRRSRDTVAREENQRLNARWFYCCHDMINGCINPWRPAELFKRLEDNLPVRLILKRNIHVMLQLIEYQQKKVYVLYTIGFNTLGVDELLIVFEKRSIESDAYMPANLIRPLMRFSETCLNPTSNLLDDKNGIRQCANRMSTLFELYPDETEGHNAVAIYFHPYQNQDLTSIAHPNNGAFRIGLFVQESELPMVRAMPSRFLHRLGMVTSVYPSPILNEIGRAAVFEPFKSTNEMASATILTMFHDFRNNTYQLPRIPGSYSLIRESGTQICLPVWAQDQVKRMAETNTNLLAWALELSYQADSLFACERMGNTFSTRIFMRSNTREVISAAFIAFATGHKGSDTGFTQTVVEDGIVIRLTSDGLENLLKRLASGEDFLLDNDASKLEVKWIENEALTAYGSISSPIDGMDLRGFYQYGLLLNRAVHANQTFFTDKSKALRLGSVISLNHHRMDPQIQSHFFDACEQLTLWLKTSLENFVHMLLGLEITQISVRIYASADRVGYDLAPWLGLEDAYEEFLKILAEKIIPFLYHLLESTQMDFRAELHLPIISIQPLLTLDTEILLGDFRINSAIDENASNESPSTNTIQTTTSS